MLLVVFLKQPGLGLAGTVRVSMWNCAVRSGTLNSRIPRHFDVT